MSPDRDPDAVGADPDAVGAEPDAVRKAFRAEAMQLGEVLSGLSAAELDRPTGCPPWTVRDLVAHVRIAVDRLTEVLDQPAPTEVRTDAAGYFAPTKFARAEDDARVDLARQEAAADRDSGDAVDHFDRTWRAAERAVSAAPPYRPVRTRHGDLMTLHDFLLTRVVELGVHGLDLAFALDRSPWLTEPAAVLVADLMAGPDGREAPAALGWDRMTFIAKATGRAPLSDEERAEAERRGVRWLSFR